MGVLAPTPNLGLILPDPGTGQPFSTATQNGWFQTIDQAIGDLRDMVNPSNQQFRSTSTGDMSLTSTNHPFQLGPTGGVNMRMDNNELQGVNNGAASPIYIQPEGGDLTFGKTDGTSKITMAGHPYHGVVPSAVSPSGGTASLNANGWVDFSAVGSIRFTELFSGYSGFDAFEVFIQITDSPAPGSSQPLFLGLASGTTARSSLLSAYRSFNDPAVSTFTYGGSGSASQDANIGTSGNLQLIAGALHLQVYFPMTAGQPTMIRFQGVTVQSSSNYNHVEGYVVNPTAQVDDGLRFGRGGAGVVSGRMYARRMLRN